MLLTEATRLPSGLGDDALLDLGEHRVKDFDEPVRILQLGAERFPPLKTISNTNLPRPASSFVGREREMTELVGLIRDEGARLVTLTGLGGSGKTRSRSRPRPLVGDHRAGTFWVELAAIRDPALAIAEIGTTLGAAEGLADHIGDELLLVLDNLEQVMDVAPELADLGETCPNLRSSSRAGADARARRGRVPVEPLADPDAVALFRARAGAASEDDDVGALCRALDDMPLAIVLAAARAKVLSPADPRTALAASRPADGRPRRRPAPANAPLDDRVVHDLLGADEQRLFASLAVFAGGCTSRWRRTSPKPTSTRSSPSWRRASSGSSTAASGCTRRSGVRPGAARSLGRG